MSRSLCCLVFENTIFLFLSPTHVSGKKPSEKIWPFPFLRAGIYCKVSLFHYCRFYCHFPPSSFLAFLPGSHFDLGGHTTQNLENKKAAFYSFPFFFILPALNGHIIVQSRGAMLTAARNKKKRGGIPRAEGNILDKAFLNSAK